jgi:hypothetical protein
MSGSSAERGLRVLHEIEKRADSDSAKEARSRLNRIGINAAWKYAHSLGWIDSAVKAKAKMEIQVPAHLEDSEMSSEDNDKETADSPSPVTDDAHADEGWLTEPIVSEIFVSLDDSDPCTELKELILKIRPHLYSTLGSSVSVGLGPKLKIISKVMSQLSRKLTDDKIRSDTEALGSERRVSW